METLEMFLINCEIYLILSWSYKCALSNDAKAITFAITERKIYVPAVTLSTQENSELLWQLKWGFKRTINWNKYQSKVKIQAPNPYLDNLIDHSFHEVNRLFGSVKLVRNAIKSIFTYNGQGITFDVE